MKEAIILCPGFDALHGDFYSTEHLIPSLKGLEGIRVEELKESKITGQTGKTILTQIEGDKKNY